MVIRSLQRVLTAGLLVTIVALPLTTQASSVGASLTGSADVRGVLQDVTVSSLDVDARGTANASTSVHTSTDATTTLETESAPIVMTRSDLQATGTATTAEDGTLSAHVRSRLAADARIDSVALSAQQVSLTYRVPTKLFGFIPVETPLRVTVRANGTTTVSYPWYGFLLTGNQAGLTLRAQAAAQAVIATPPASDTLSAQTQSTLLDSLTAALAVEGSATP